MHKLKNMIELDKIVFPIPINRIYFDKLYFDKTITTDRIERYKLNKKYVKGILGLINLSVNDNNAIISLSGKFLSDANDLGSITKNNYDLIFDRFNKTGFIEIKPLLANEIQVFNCDVKKDILVSNISKSLFGINKHLEMLSDKYNITIHKDLSIFLKSNTKDCKDILNIYRKYDELVKHDNKEYLKIVGYHYLDKCKNMLRIERRLSSFEAIRKAFNITHDGYIYLNEILNSNANPIKSKFEDLKLTEEFVR